MGSRRRKCAFAPAVRAVRARRVFDNIVLVVESDVVGIEVLCRKYKIELVSLERASTDTKDDRQSPAHALSKQTAHLLFILSSPAPNPLTKLFQLPYAQAKHLSSTDFRSLIPLPSTSDLSLLSESDKHACFQPMNGVVVTRPRNQYSFANSWCGREISCGASYSCGPACAS